MKTIVSLAIDGTYYKYFEVKFQDIHSFYICVSPNLIRYTTTKITDFEATEVYVTLTMVNVLTMITITQDVIDIKLFGKTTLKLIWSIEEKAKQEIDAINKEIDFLNQEIESLDIVAKEIISMHFVRLLLNL